MAEAQMGTTPDYWSRRGFMTGKANCNRVGMIDCDMVEDYSEFRVENRFPAVNSGQEPLRAAQRD